MTKDQIKILYDLRDEGHAICIFTPDELQGADIDEVEFQMAKGGGYVINDHLAEMGEEVEGDDE